MVILLCTIGGMPGAKSCDRHHGAKVVRRMRARLFDVVDAKGERQ